MRPKLSRAVIRLTAAVLISLLLTISAFAAATYQSISGYTTPAGVTSVQTSAADTANKIYPWALQEDGSLKSTNVNASSSVSVLKVTVTGSGVLNFVYKVSSCADEGYAEYLLVKSGTEITGISDKAGANQSYCGIIDWTSGNLSVTAEDNATTDIYFAYCQDGSWYAGDDCAWLRNISFTPAATNFTVTAASSNTTYGTVSGGGEYSAGADVTLTAAAAEGGKFYGWQVNNKLVCETADYTFTAAQDVSATAIFGEEATVVAQNRITGNIYADLKTALDDAQIGAVVVLMKDTALTQDAELKAGRTLYVPYSAEYDADGNADGTTANSQILAASAQTYRTLSIDSGVTFTISGTLRIGGVIGYPNQYYQGHTSGAHGRVTNSGTIAVSAGGILDCWGFIDGSGTVTASDGAALYEPFIVYDFSGGWNTVDLYQNGESPFSQYTMQNISCTLVIHSGAALTGRCNLYASSSYNKTDAAIIGGSGNAIFKLSDGAVLTRTVDKSKSISGATVSSPAAYGSDLGRVTYTVSGGGEFDHLSMTVMGVDVSTAARVFPIPYGYSYVLTNGTYTIPKMLKIMPGAEMTVASNAKLSVSGTLYVLDGLLQTDMSGKYYPSTTNLETANFPVNGVLTVNGQMTVESTGTFGGIVQSGQAGARVIAEDGATVANPAVRVGAVGCYDDNTVVMPLNGRVMIGETLTDMSDNMIYTAAAATDWTLNGYTITQYAGETLSATAPATGTLGVDYSQVSNGDKSGDLYCSYIFPEDPIAISQPMTGLFSAGTREYTVTVVNKTAYNEGDNTRVTVEGAMVDSDNAVNFTVSATEAGAGYVWMVQYQMEGGALTPLTANADGSYTITGVSKDITITVTSVKLGDVNGDGKINSADALKVLYFSTGRETASMLQALASDVNDDGKTNSADALRILYFSTGRITQF